MNIYLDCLPCFVRQSIDAARNVTQNTQVHEQIVREVLRLTAELDFSMTPPRVGQLIHRRLREMTGVDDPYREIKTKFNTLAMDLLPELEREVKQSADPLLAATKLAIGANIIDLGAKSSITEQQAYTALRESNGIPILGNWEEFKQKLTSAKNILYLADNAGEIAIDRLLVEQLGPSRVTCAVRGKPVINDATMADAYEVGLHELVEVIDNGSDAPGTILSDCSEVFRNAFHRADMIISKGQGNFETLSEVDASIFFLFKVKCPVIGENAGLPTGTHALLYSKADNYKANISSKRQHE